MDTTLTYVHIESSTHCNAKCIMCPHSNIARHGTMDYGLFTSIVDQAIELGCQAFTPFRVGEPLLFPDLFRWLDYFRSKGARAAIYTNGSALVPKIADQLKEYRDVIYEFTISFHGYDEESYNTMMGLDFNTVYERIKNFTIDNPMPIGLYTLANDPYDLEHSKKFKKLWEDLDINTGICQYMEWAGTIEGFRTFRTMVAEEDMEVEIVPCNRILHEIDVMYDGTVCLCCVDAHGEITFGNLRDQPLSEIMNHRLRRYYQEKHISGDIEDLPLCKDCSTNLSPKK